MRALKVLACSCVIAFVACTSSDDNSGIDAGVPDGGSIATDGGGAKETGSDAAAIDTGIADTGSDTGASDAADAADAAHGPWQYTVVAGNGSSGFSGDNGPATSAQLGGYLSGMAKDAAGNLYIADAGNARIRKVDTSGNIHTFAGTGTPGYSGDNGPATSATINGPAGVAVDAAGNVYFAEFNNDVIRKVDTSGNISTYVSLAGSAPTGIAIDASGNLYVAMYSQNQIWKYDTAKTRTVVAGTGSGFGGDGAAATSAMLSNPNGVWVDAAGNLYIVDCNNHRIRKVDTSGIITTIAGNGTAGFSGDDAPATSAEINPSYGVTADAAGNVFIADSGNNRIRMVDKSGIIHTIAGTGSTTFTSATGAALSSNLNGPGYSWMDAQGAMYVSDGNTSVYKIY